MLSMCLMPVVYSSSSLRQRQMFTTTSSCIMSLSPRRDSIMSLSSRLLTSPFATRRMLLAPALMGNSSLRSILTKPFSSEIIFCFFAILLLFKLLLPRDGGPVFLPLGFRWQRYRYYTCKIPTNAIMPAFAGSTGKGRGKNGENSGGLLQSWVQSRYCFQRVF